jgi:hypothetical protein
MMMEFNPSMVGFTPEQTREFYRRLIDDVRALPGVQAASLARAIPFRPNFTEEAVVPEGYQFPNGLRSATVSSNVVDEQYFETAGTPIERGRAFTALDTADSRRMGIVNSEFARRFWPGQDPIGKRLRLGENGEFVEVVGVARTGKYLSLAETPQPYFYLPFALNPRPRMTLLVLAAAQRADLTEALYSVVRSIDANQPVFNVRRMKTYYEQGVLGPALVVLQMIGATGVVGLALALVVVPAGLMLVTAGACYFPARRAARIDPALQLR